MQLRRLRQFEALYRLRSFARAADDLGMTQSALSRSLQKLEAELGVILFDRTTHRVEPTESGRRLIARAEAVLAAAAVLNDEDRGLTDADASEVRIGAGPFPLQPLVSGAVAAMGKAAPAVRITVTSGPAELLLQGLLDRALDLVVCDTSKFRDSAYSEEILVQSLPHEPLVMLFAEHHPAAATDAGQRDFASYAWALPTPAPGAAAWLAPSARRGLEAGRFPHYELQSTAACIDIVRTGVAVTAVPASLARRALDSGGLAWGRLPTSNVTNDGIHMLRNRTRSGSMTLLIQMLREEAQRLHAGTVAMRGSEADPAAG